MPPPPEESGSSDSNTDSYSATASASSSIKVDNPWGGAENFLCRAFRMGKKFFPRVKLYYSDYDIESDYDWMEAKAMRAFNLVRSNKSCGIDGVSFQMHIDLTWDENWLAGLSDMIQMYDAIGMEVQISEFDVSMPYTTTTEWDSNVSSSTTTYEWQADEWDDSMLELQATLYQNVLIICLEEPNCTSFTTWGHSDMNPELEAPGYALPIDEIGEPKAAFTGMLDVLTAYDREDEACISRREDFHGKPSQPPPEGKEIWVDHDNLEIPLLAMDIKDINTVQRSKQQNKQRKMQYQVNQVKTVTKKVINSI